MSEPESPSPRGERPGGPPAERRRTGERLVGLLIGGAVILNYPLLSLLRDRGLIAGVPALYVYLFLVWALLAIITALVLRRKPPASGADGNETGTREP